ncbi:MAG: hypothetical protein IPN62_11525 [Flavobacteriales bacterium]|nr:hypothetical protein [Flavobacteriales bacterium]
MQRMPVLLVLVVVIAMMVAPTMVLIDFKVDQERIARELCVQRDVVEDMRTCHGDCQLSKRFRALEHQADAPFPMERVELRFEPQVPLGSAVLLVPTSATDRDLPAYAAAVLHRALPVPDGVPWAA